MRAPLSAAYCNPEGIEKRAESPAARSGSSPDQHCESYCQPLKKCRVFTENRYLHHSASVSSPATSAAPLTSSSTRVNSSVECTRYIPQESTMPLIPAFRKL